MNYFRNITILITFGFILLIGNSDMFSQIGLTIPINYNATSTVARKSELESRNFEFAKQNFVTAYSQFIETVDDNVIKLKQGKTFIWDDGVKKSFEEKLDKADLEDMVSQNYLSGIELGLPPAYEFSPGRIRNEEFLKAIYGTSESEVRKNCTTVDWFGHKLSFNRVNGAADSLKAVIYELNSLPKELKKYFTNVGTFYWRFIAGTKRLSMHSFALAIDINTKYSDYWRYSKINDYKNRIPLMIVEVFEKHGFIWGGKWYHYDTMHFEFRPEFFVHNKVVSSEK